MTDADNPLLLAALQYAALGLPVFPCAPSQKRPTTEHGFHDATTDEATIRAWWRDYPRANIGVPTGAVSGVIVLDIDPRHGGDVSIDDLQSLNGPFPETAMSLTGGGGRHVFLKHPAGQVRCTHGELAPGIDVKGDGGYVVMPPSVHPNGNPYAWELSSDITETRAAACPEWLVRLILQGETARAAVINGSAAKPIPEGERNGTLARLAGAMRRVGMSPTEILAALRQVNADRCSPPVSPREVEQIAASIGRYEPNAISVALAENHWTQDRGPPTQPRPMTVRELMAAHPTLRAPLINGILRRGETMNVIAPPKTGKSWLVLALAMAVASGRKWLDTFETFAGNVLIIDNELHPETLAHRIPQVAEGLRIGMNEIADTVSVQSMRGQLRDIFSLGQYFASIEVGRYALIVLDAFYRFMPRDMDENDNGTMANIYNHIDALAERLNCSFVLIHHATKGNQSGKAVTDVGAGAGSQSRAADAHVVLRPHEEPGAVVLEAAVRSWAPIAPMALRWTFPVWTAAPDLDPAALRSEKPKRVKPAPQEPAEPPDWSVERFVEAFIGAKPVTLPELREHATKDPGLSWRRISDLLSIAEHKGMIRRVRLPGRGGPQGFVVGAEEEGS
ncbi:MAG: bifunctional DNA primase/polymerase [Phycisphaerae bacterium]|nr:bifunctional DNA primase/polymerase [Planctomycetia bacterium]MCL4718729.1 bifunctional DNA primase/polymerase [Phycisphaerae bacterium]